MTNDKQESRLCKICGSTENYIIHLNPDVSTLWHNLKYHEFQPVERRVAERRRA